MDKNYRTLIADDSRAMRLALELCLKGSEFDVVGQASNGLEAIDQVDELQPDIVLMDIAMPGVSGIEALKQIKEKRSDVIVFMISSLATKKMKYDAFKLGAKNFLQKPIVKEEILDVLRSSLSKDSAS